MTASPLANNWLLGDRPDLGAMNGVNRLITALDHSNPLALPSFDGARQLMVDRTTAASIPAPSEGLRDAEFPGMRVLLRAMETSTSGTVTLPNKLRL